jgi:adenylate cyclase
VGPAAEMSERRVERRLAAILAVDVAGYSRLMGEDEEGTLAGLKAIRRELGDPKIAEHRGRIVKTTGDGLLVEFASVIDAVRCAVDVQRGMAARNEAVPAGRRIEFRMGINVGDIIIEDGDIFGDGVNIAARLEALAEPGNICISARVQEDSAGRLDLAFRDLGEQQLKNIARPVRAYAIETGPVRLVAPAAPSAPRLSIVVLPFANLSNDPEQEYFADALTEDLTTDLSRIEGMFVIARGTAFTFKDKTGDAKQIGRELGVRYVLEGSVRKLGPRIRVNAQLIDAETAAHLWAERFDRDAEDLFAVQDEITSRIAIELNFNLLAAEAAKPTENPTALDYLLRGRAAMMAPSSQDRYVRALPLLERSLALDPQSVVIRSRLAHALAARVMDGTSADAADIERALALAEDSLAISPRDPLAHYARGQVLRALGRWEEAVADYEACIAGNRNFAIAYPHLAACRMWSGEIDVAIPLIERAIRLSPRDPDIGTFYARIGVVHLLQSRVDESIAWSEKARPAIPAAVTLCAWLASAYGLAGNDERAASELAEARRRASDDRYSSIARLRSAGNYPTAPGNWGVPKIRGLVEATYFAGLRKAGMLEE